MMTAAAAASAAAAAAADPKSKIGLPNDITAVFVVSEPHTPFAVAKADCLDSYKSRFVSSCS